MNVPDKPTDVVWDLTYTCPLRCSHCYSESGRRPNRQLPFEDMLEVAYRICDLKPSSISLSGGEPLSVRRIVDIADIFSEAGISVHLYTSGWSWGAATLEKISEVVTKLSVSIDGAVEATHDRIRGRRGSFRRALAMLEEIDCHRELDRTTFSFGVDYVVTRSNFEEVPQFIPGVMRRFKNIGYVNFNAVMPSGLANRDSYARAELLTAEQLRKLADPSFRSSVVEQSPSGLSVNISDNLMLMMRPDLVEKGWAFMGMHVEPDGKVRAIPIYEGTVGSLLDSSPLEIWRKSVARWSDPDVVDLLSTATYGLSWATAAREIDKRFASPDDRNRISNRPLYDPT
ncbi:radical SAM protein [Streptomyces sp. TX20-6-3]|uniref:radical SAM protein n=1 Tax=Streptomyces sp. TX20-6-3 TaxID=3028705 RepID=UPI0029BCD673|nr:radical SAM protein [Streptomyces sp. TX20-6-3]MDX2565241.1 radical SAM protein [Streptomyces sp. TX20-6-3]